MFGMYFIEGGVQGVNEKVVHVNDEPSFSDHIAEGVIHEPLEGSRGEGSRGVGESKEHDSGFK